MSEDMKTAAGATPAKGRFPDGFDQVLYWVSVKRKAFDIPKFRRSLPRNAKHLDEALALISPRDAKRCRFHVLFAWSITADELKFNIGYHSGPLDLASHDSDDSDVSVDGEPYAEDFMQWFGQFFRAHTVKCHIHARFEYTLKKRRSTFPFTLTTKQLPGGAEIYGVALRLATAPNGASSVRITQGRKRWFADVVSDGRLSFEAFSPYTDADESMAVLGMFLAEANS